MKLEEDLMARLRKLQEERGISGLSENSGVDQSNFSRALGKKKQQLGLDKVSKTLDAMGAIVVFPDSPLYAKIHGDPAAGEDGGKDRKLRKENDELKAANSRLYTDNQLLETQLGAYKDQISAADREIRILHAKLERAQAKVITLQEKMLAGVPGYKDDEDEAEEMAQAIRKARGMPPGSGVVQEEPESGQKR